jgi:hypothetical protein
MGIYRAVAFAVLFLALATSSPVRARAAAKIVIAQQPLLRDEAAASKLILYGHLGNARKGPDGGSTDLVIHRVLKEHPALTNRRRVRLPRYLDIADAKSPPRLLVFADLYNGKLDFYRGIAATPALVDYFQGLLTIDLKDRVKLLRYCFDYLDHPDREITVDAYQEFVRSADAEIRQVAKHLSGTRLRRWLQDPRTPPERRNLYGFLLGNCGGDLDADLLRDLLKNRSANEDPTRREGILKGYVLLKPQEGWAHVRGLLAPSGSFWVRLAGFRTIQFLDSTRPGVVPKKTLLAGLQVLLDQGDIADLAIEFLRQQRCWDLTGQVLPLFTRPSHNTPLMRRAIVRYALQCPGPQAREFVAMVRRDDPELVTETQELLKLEASSVPRKR